MKKKWIFQGRVTRIPVESGTRGVIESHGIDGRMARARSWPARLELVRNRSRIGRIGPWTAPYLWPAIYPRFPEAGRTNLR